MSKVKFDATVYVQTGLYQLSEILDRVDETVDDDTDELAIRYFELMRAIIGTKHKLAHNINDVSCYVRIHRVLSTLEQYISIITDMFAVAHDRHKYLLVSPFVPETCEWLLETRSIPYMIAYNLLATDIMGKPDPEFVRYTLANIDFTRSGFAYYKYLHTIHKACDQLDTLYDRLISAIERPRCTKTPEMSVVFVGDQIDPVSDERRSYQNIVTAFNDMQCDTTLYHTVVGTTDEKRDLFDEYVTIADTTELNTRKYIETRYRVAIFIGSTPQTYLLSRMCIADMQIALSGAEVYMPNIDYTVDLRESDYDYWKPVKLSTPNMPIYTDRDIVVVPWSLDEYSSNKQVLKRLAEKSNPVFVLYHRRWTMSSMLMAKSMINGIQMDYIFANYSEEYINLLRNAKYALVTPHTTDNTLLDIACHHIRIMVVTEHRLAQVLDPLVMVTTPGAIYSNHKRMLKQPTPQKFTDTLVTMCDEHNKQAVTKFTEWFETVAQFTEYVPEEPRKSKSGKRRSHRRTKEVKKLQSSSSSS